MPTIVTLTVGSNNRQYATLAAAWAAIPADLVSADVAYVLELYNDSEFTLSAQLNLAGKTTDADHNIVIRPAAGQGFTNNGDTPNRALRYNRINGVGFKATITAGVAFNVDNDWLTVEGLQFKIGGTGVIGGVANSRINSVTRNCLVEFDGNASSTDVAFNAAFATFVSAGCMFNVLVILTNELSNGMRPWTSTSYNKTGAALIEGVTIVRLASVANSRHGFYSAYVNSVTNKIFRNCAVFNCAMFTNRPTDGIWQNCAYSGSIGVGGNGHLQNLVAADVFVDPQSDFRPKAGSPLIDAGTTPDARNNIALTGNRQMGAAADIGAWETPSAIVAPTATITSITVTGRSVAVSGTTTGVPTSGTLAFAPASTPYNSAEALGPVALVLGSGTFTSSFANAKAGAYTLDTAQSLVANANYEAGILNGAGPFEVVGPRAITVSQQAVGQDQVLTINGTSENATGGTLIVPGPPNNPSVAEKTVSVVVSTTPNPDTFTVSVPLPAGDYSGMVLRLTGPAGTSLPVEGLASVSVSGPRATTTVQQPIDGQVLRINGTFTGLATGGVWTVPAAAENPNGATTVSAPIVINGTNYSSEIVLAPGNYDTSTFAFTNAAGPGLPQAGGGPVSVLAISGEPEAPGTEPGQTDTTAPTITAAVVASSAPGVVVLTASEPLNTSFVPAASAFAVTGHTVSSVALAGSAINLTVTPNFANGEAPRTVSYTQPGTNGARDAAGNLVASFSGLAITNNVAAPVSTVTGVTISPTAATVAGGATQQFTASVQGTNSPAQGVTWTRSPAVGSVSASGLYTAPAATNTAQVIEVTATSTQNPNFSAKATVTVPPASPAGTSFTRSIARTIRVKPAPQMFEGGAFWNTSNKTRPVGTIDKDETIDVSFDLTEVLADISDTVKQIDFDLDGLTSVGGYFTGAVATVFVSNAIARAGGRNPTITCKMTTNSTPARKEDWTVELRIEEQ